LVREISIGDALIGNLLIFNLVIASMTLLIIPYTFPGSNLPPSVGVMFPLALCPALVYVLLAIAMPRSGGDYVYVSRSINPALGFAANFTIIAWNMLWIGVYCNWVSTIGLSGMFSTLGTLLNSPALFAMGSAIVNPLPTILI
jgi:amino acid transporter